MKVHFAANAVPLHAFAVMWRQHYVTDSTDKVVNANAYGHLTYIVSIIVPIKV